MGEALNWDVDAADYVRSRPNRYSGGMSIEPEWAQEVMDDPELAALEPDPKSRMAHPGSSDTHQVPGVY